MDAPSDAFCFLGKALAQYTICVYSTCLVLCSVVVCGRLVWACVDGFDGGVVCTVVPTPARVMRDPGKALRSGEGGMGVGIVRSVRKHAFCFGNENEAAKKWDILGSGWRSRFELIHIVYIHVG